MISVKVMGLSGILVAPAVLPACVLIDRYAPRQYQLNVSSQQALNEESLLNIIRSSQHDPLTFIAVSQLVPSHTEAFNFGIPTITFGPGQTEMQKQFIFGGNMVQNSASGSFTMNPLISSDFEKGMLSPISPDILATLILSSYREPILYAVIDSIILTRCPKSETQSCDVRKNDTDTSILYNRPGDDAPFTRAGKEVSCVDIFPPRDVNSNIMSDLDPNEQLGYIDTEFYSSENEKYCNYSKFVALLDKGLIYGLSVEVPITGAGGQGGNAAPAAAAAGSLTFQGSVTNRVPPPKSESAATSQGGASSTSSGSTAGASTNKSSNSPQSNNSSSQAGPAARFCFDDGLAQPKYRFDVRNLPHWCGNPNPPPPNKPAGFPFGTKTIEFGIVLRSPTAVFAYLGTLVRNKMDPSLVAAADSGSWGNPLADRMNYSTPEVGELRSEPFLNITNSDRGCFVHINYLDIDYCIPMQGSMNTGIILQMLQRLRNLSVSPSDLNVPFTTRVLP